MRLMKAVFGILLALTLFTVPALSQATDTTDHHDTNSKTKKAAKKAAHKTKEAADATADATKDAAGKTADATKHAAKKTKDAVTGDKTDKLDINTATKDQLMALQGIGDVYSQKIIDNRPYKSKNEIVSKAGVPQATYDKIKDQIIAHRVASGDATKPTTSTKQKKSATAPADKK